MRKKTSEQLREEAERILREAKQMQAQEAAQQKKDDRYRQCVLGVFLEQEMRRDPALRARVEAGMDRFCTRARDRDLFAFGLPQTWFGRLTASGSDATERARASKDTSANESKPASSSAVLMGAMASAPAAAKEGTGAASSPTGASGGSSPAPRPSAPAIASDGRREAPGAASGGVPPRAPSPAALATSASQSAGAAGASS